MTKTFFHIAIVLLFFSCSKNQDAATTSNPCNNIVQVLAYNAVTDSYDPDVDIVYDDQQRIKNTKKKGLSQAIYTYYSDSIRLEATDIFGNDISVTYYLDTKNRITKTNFFDYEYTYNDDGYLISFKEPLTSNGHVTGSIQYYLTYENNNLQELYTNDVSTDLRQVTMEYYPEPNQILIGYNSPLYLSTVIPDRNSFFLIQAGFYGKESENLIKHIDFHDGYSAADKTYKKDAQGRIIQIPEHYAFNYQCP
ncbi:MAG TPA: hypothetical protein VEV83_18835 [Parafilimonas sp.]|nr:hypothetical protein [Parafilimonas sp.]